MPATDGGCPTTTITAFQGPQGVGSGPDEDGGGKDSGPQYVCVEPPTQEPTVAPTAAVDPCANGVKDGSETDVDCGGDAAGCARCSLGEQCVEHSDCESGACDNGGGRRRSMRFLGGDKGGALGGGPNDDLGGPTGDLEKDKRGDDKSGSAETRFGK